MCFPKPNIPDAPEPVITPPEPQKKLELNPALTKSSSKKSKRLGTRKLQIPLGGAKAGGSSGLNTGT